MRITLLADNTALPGFEKEWGLSMALELDSGGFWLWDAGATGLFLRTAGKLDIDPLRADGLAISHGHWDHTGGLDELLDAGFTAPIFAHEDMVLTRYSLKGRDGKKEEREIGLPGRIPEFVRVHDKARLAPDLHMLTDIPRLEGNSQAVDGFFLDREGTMPDATADDAFLVADTKKGPVIILGCCHSGLANSLACAAARLGVHTPHAIIGGLHFFGVDKDAWEQAARAIEESRAKLVVTGHCTGDDGLKWLQSRLGIPVQGMGTGTVLEF